MYRRRSCDEGYRRSASSWRASGSEKQISALEQDNVQLLIASEAREWETVPYVQTPLAKAVTKHLSCLGIRYRKKPEWRNVSAGFGRSSSFRQASLSMTCVACRRPNPDEKTNLRTRGIPGCEFAERFTAARTCLRAFHSPVAPFGERAVNDDANLYFILMQISHTCTKTLLSC